MSATLHPYLGPRAHLSLSWLSQSFLALLLLFISLYALLSTIPHLVLDAKQAFTAACSGVEGASNVMISLPHYMADGVNELNKKSVDAITGGAATVLDLGLEALEAIIIFMINTYQSLYLCLLDLVVHGSLDLLISGVEEAESFVTEAFQGVRTELQDAVELINKGFNATFGLVSKLGLDVPQIGVPDLTALQNVTIPSTLVDSLTTLNTTIPTLSELRNTLDSLISTPIDTLRSRINSTLSNATIDIAQLPVPAKKTVVFCSNLDTDFIDDIGHDMSKFIKIALGLIGLVAALFILVNAYWERYRYRCYLEGVERARDAWKMDMGSQTSAKDSLSRENLLSFLGAAEHPTLALLAARLAAFFRLSPDTRSSLHWFFAYIFHPIAWIFLLLGVIGLIVVQIQLALLEGPIKSAVQAKANAGAGGFSNQVVGLINANMLNTSQEFANSSNAVIQSVQNGVNNDLFGWVNTTTTAMNSTLNTFYTDLTSSISNFFNGTPLQNPALDLVYCLIGSKVTGVEKALTWIHDNAHIDLPTVSDNVLMLSTNRTKELTSSLTSPNSTVSSTLITNRMIDRYAESLRQQRLGYIICIAIWVLVLLMGLFGVFWRHRGRAMWKRRSVARRSTFLPAEEKDVPMFASLYRSASETVASPRKETPRTNRNYSPMTFNLQESLSTWRLNNPFMRFKSSSGSREAPEGTRLRTFALPTRPGLSNTFALPTRPTLQSFSGAVPLRGEKFQFPKKQNRRRDSDMVDLRTGTYLERSVPGGGHGGRFREAGRSVGEVLRRARGERRDGRDGSITSFGERDEGDWEELDVDTHPVNDSSVALPHLAHGADSNDRPFLNYLIATVSPPAYPVQDPLSPPPNGVIPDVTLQNLHSFPPLVPDAPTRQPSTYQPSSRPRNPFATPFDAPGEQ